MEEVIKNIMETQRLLSQRVDTTNERIDLVNQRIDNLKDIIEAQQDAIIKLINKLNNKS